nr:hypothetical protein BaRGS_033467 [Batillaria attramentaria]
MLSGLLWMDAHALLSTLADNQRQAADRRHVVLRDTAILLQAGFKGGLSLVQKERTTLRPAKNLNGSIPLPHRSVICDFEIRQHENVHRYAVQCLLPLSPVYSKAFTFLFYFFLLLTVLSVLDLLIWVGRVIIPGLRDAAVQRYLNAVSGGDGGRRLLLALTADYCGPLAAADLTNHLWVIFKGAPRIAPCASNSVTAAEFQRF